MGRPSRYTDKLAATICQRIADGKSLVSICKSAKMPSYTTVMRWLDEKEDFRDMYAHAREQQAERFAQEIIDIADEEPDLNRAKLRMDARKWTATKLLPRKYGDRVAMEHSGEGGAPLRIIVEEVSGNDKAD